MVSTGSPSPLRSPWKSGDPVVCGGTPEKPSNPLMFCSINTHQTRLLCPLIVLLVFVADVPAIQRTQPHIQRPVQLVAPGVSQDTLASSDLSQSIQSNPQRLLRPSPKQASGGPAYQLRHVPACLTHLHPSGELQSRQQERPLENAAVTSTLSICPPEAHGLGPSPGGKDCSTPGEKYIDIRLFSKRVSHFLTFATLHSTFQFSKGQKVLVAQ